jgi:hypothetical protein
VQRKCKERILEKNYVSDNFLTIRWAYMPHFREKKERAKKTKKKKASNKIEFY